MGHTVSVKVQRVHRVKKVVAPYGAQILKKGGAAGAAGCVEGLRKKVLRIDGPFRAQGFLSLTALRAEGCGLPLDTPAA